MSTSTCVRCDRPTAGAQLCARHTRTLLVALRHVAEYHPELEVLATRRVRFTTGGSSSIGKSQPLPVDERFVDTGKAGGSARLAPGSVLRLAVHATLGTWCRVLIEEHPTLTDQPTRDTVPAMCAYLDRQHRLVLAAPWVDELLSDLLDAERQLRRTIDRPPERWYAGVCSARLLSVDEHGAVIDGGECAVDLYAIEDEVTVTCPGCGTVHDVDARREHLLDQAEDVLVTATEAAAALVQWAGLEAEQTKVAQRVRQWVARKRLQPKGLRTIGGTDEHPITRPTYRLGDVRALLEDHARRAHANR